MFSSTMDTSLTIHSLETVNITSQPISGKCGLYAKPQTPASDGVTKGWVSSKAKTDLEGAYLGSSHQPAVIADTSFCSSASRGRIAMLKALLPLGSSRLACLTSIIPFPSTSLTLVGPGHQAELRRTYSHDWYSRRGTYKLHPSFLHQSSPSLTHWRGKRSLERRREAEMKMVNGGKSFTKPWQPEEDQVGVSAGTIDTYFKHCAQLGPLGDLFVDLGPL